MKIFFRVDASHEVGIGHVSRCLNLADALRRKGYQSLFAISNANSGLKRKITIRGHKVSSLEKSASDPSYNLSAGTSMYQLLDANRSSKIIKGYNPDLLIVDHYNLDNNWEQMLDPIPHKIMVIDDLANRKHFCNFLLDQTPIRDPKDYKNLVDPSTSLLIGSQYTILSSDFNFYRAKNLQRPVSRKNILVGFGGLDSKNLIPKVLNFLEQRSDLKECKINIVISSIAPQLKFLEAITQSSSLQISLNIDPKNFTELLAGSDFAICAGGLMSLELACLGIPAIILPFSGIQRDVSLKLSDEVDFFIASRWEEDFEASLTMCFESILKALSRNKKRRVHSNIDGLGVDKVVDFIINYA